MELEGPSAAAVRGADLSFEPFNNSFQVQNFDCGNEDLNNFLNSQEVMLYERDHFGKTTLVYLNGEVVGYYTISPYALKVAYAQRVPDIRPEYRNKMFSCVFIGRLAVHVKHQGKGVGRLIVKEIARRAVNDTFLPVRLLVLAAERPSIPFYEKLGFRFTEKRQNEKAPAPMMYFNLDAVRNALVSRQD